MPLPLAPNEHVSGTIDQRRALLAHLANLRVSPPVGQLHPELSCTALADLLATPAPFIDETVLRTGITITARRYGRIGLTSLLPAERTFIATGSANPAAFGGFHYPGQGYRHWQMISVITRYGHLAGPEPPDPRLAALDLIRAYAHDSLHYGSYRRYQHNPDGTGPIRTRYGINFRRPDGRTYSLPDTQGSPSTRNLGIIMEGATDREAQAITRHTARLAHITCPSADPDRAEYRDVTGCPAPHAARSSDPRDNTRPFLTRMTAYRESVTSRYQVLLTELSPHAPGSLHTAILRAMITGSLASLCHDLNQRHGPAAFTRMFRTSTFTRP